MIAKITMRTTSALFGLVVLALVLGPLALSLWLDARWFSAQGLGAVFALRLGTQLGLGVVAAILAGVFLALNALWAALRLRRVASKEDKDSRGMATLFGAIPAASVVLGIGFGLAAFGDWQTWLGFQAQVPFGQTDPTFGRDIAFYVWTLPALTAARGWLTALLIVTAIATLIVYGIGLMSIEAPVVPGRPYPFIARERDFRYHPLLAPTVRHIAVLGAAFLLLVSAGYWINNLQLVYSSRGVVYGASATDMHAVYPANAIMAGVAVILALLLLFIAIRPSAGASTGFLVTAAAVPILWLGIGFLLGEVWPALYEQVAVHPNQLGAESQYISNNIVSTRAAMALDKMDEFGLAQIPVFEDGKQVGSLRENRLLGKVLRNRELMDAPVCDVLEPGLPIVDVDASLNEITRELQKSPAVLVEEYGRITGIITRHDILDTPK